MSNYSLFTCENGGKYLIPKEEMLTDEAMPLHHKLYLSETLIKDGDHSCYRYRLCSADMTRFVDTLEYGVECPRCHGRLRLCGMPVDAYTHGLYKCRHCDEDMRGRD